MSTFDETLRFKSPVSTLYGPGLRAFFRIADIWNLSEAEQMNILGQSSRATLANWRSGEFASCNVDALERISYVLGIYKGIHTIFAEHDMADGWMRRPNKAPAFGGRTAIERMTDGSVRDLEVVRQYIDSLCS
jgi:hypothetical protein